MTTYEFTLVLSGSPELTDDMADALFASGCDDGSPGSCNGVVSIDFHREAASLEDAIRSAMSNVRSAGYDVASVRIEAGSMAG